MKFGRSSTTKTAKAAPALSVSRFGSSESESQPDADLILVLLGPREEKDSSERFE